MYAPVIAFACSCCCFVICMHVCVCVKAIVSCSCGNSVAALVCRLRLNGGDALLNPSLSFTKRPEISLTSFCCDFYSICCYCCLCISSLSHRRQRNDRSHRSKADGCACLCGNGAETTSCLQQVVCCMPLEPTYLPAL